MNPNDVEMVRVYSREVSGTVVDETFPAGTDVECAVDCEAGATIFGLSPPFEVTIHVRDLMENHEIDHSATISGNLSNADWPTPARTHTFTIPAGPLQEGHIFNVLAVLTVGGADPIVSFSESNMFVVT